MSQTHHPQPANKPRRLPSGGRPHTMLTPGVLRESKQPQPQLQQQQQQQQQRLANPQAHAQAQRLSMPPPLALNSTSKVTYPEPKAAYTTRQQGPPGQHPAPASPGVSRGGSPAGPGLPAGMTGAGAATQHLRETSRTNIAGGKGSMPPPRQPSATLGRGEKGQYAPVSGAGAVPGGKEQWAKTTRERERASWAPGMGGRDNDVEEQFRQLLESLQVPETVRQKFASVSQDVKSSILSSTLTSNPAILTSLGLPVPPSQTPQPPKMRKKLSTPLLRRAKSSGSLKGEQPQPEVGGTYSVGGEGFVIVASPQSSSSGVMSPPLYPDAHTHMNPRGQSLDLGRPSSAMRSPAASPRPTSRLFGGSGASSASSFGKSAGKGLGIAMGEQPEAFTQWLASYKGTDLKMEVARCKKLRMLLRHEATDWVHAFVDLGGYGLVLDRLQDLLDIEWRDEQHDDQMLYELLRCIKAMSTSEIGKAAIRKSFPRPFPALSTLLFSEKKPGDLASRQIIVELWIFLYDLFPTSPLCTSPNTNSAAGAAGRARPTSVRFDRGAGLPAGASAPVHLTETIRGLLVPDLPDPTKEQHDFVTKAHRPRVFRAWVGELSDICRDYFWIMCHASNTLWALEQVNEPLVEKPVAPGGATGGVEFEAMNYVTTHFKLLNAFCRQLAVEDMEKARKLHYELMASGMDRILVTFRKASTTYYPTVHLELARYIALLKAASPDGKLPYLISKMVGPPPEEVARHRTRKEWLPIPVGAGSPSRE